MKNKIIESGFGLVALVALATVSWKPAYAAQAQPAQSCEQMSAEIQSINAEMQGSVGAMQGNMSEMMRLQQRQMTASALAGAIPLPIVGSVVGQAAGAADRQRVADLQREQQATQQHYMSRLPTITARLQTLAVQFEAQCLSGATPAGSGAADRGGN